jgi:hypothetical protein
MSQDAATKNWRWRSPRTARICACLLAAIIAGYLVVITYSLHDKLSSSRSIIFLLILWGLGILALNSLTRCWRHLKKLDAQQDSDN